MAKPRTVFACKACGALQTKWMGKCPDCGAWDALEAQRVEPKARVDPRAAAAQAFVHAAARAEANDGPEGAPGKNRSSNGARDIALMEPLVPASPALPIGEIETTGASIRIATGIAEFDRVLGGGIVPASAILLGGDPGIGKSTLLLQAAQALAARGHRTLYVSSEESAQQVKLRASRLLGASGQVTGDRGQKEGDRGQGVVDSTAHPHLKLTESLSAHQSPVPSAQSLSNLFLLAETSLNRITEQAARVLADADPARPAVMIIDSVQMVYKADLEAFPGSLTQLRRCCAELVYLAKAAGVAVILVGHVTKDGQLAGPRMLEHLVDAVLYFEGDRHHAHRIVRAVKNRFGSTLELGLFEMTDRGLREAPDGVSVASLGADAPPRPGTVVCPVLTGTRCLMVELQALTATGFLGAAKRKSSGLDPSRLSMLIAVLEQHGGLRLADRDIFASAVGGVRVAEPAADLAILLAIAGAHAKRSAPASSIALGEVGLAGEVRSVSRLEQRLRDAARLGAKTAIIPAAAKRERLSVPGLELVYVKTVNDAIGMLM
ncbi:MAG: DNA repair protein RadA [Phycisphaerales bacterium]